MTTVTRTPAAAPRSLVGRAVPDAAAMLPALALLVLWLVWIGASGGYYPTLWYPSALGCLSLLIVTGALRRQWLPAAGAARVALIAFAALVAWNYLSIIWAGDPGSALSAADELLLYLLVGWTLSILPWTFRGLMFLLIAWTLGIAGFCVVDLLRALGASHLVSFFVEYRWATPLGYPNATGALAMMGMLPAIVLASSRGTPAGLRVVLLPVAGFLAEFAFLPQSRAVLFGMIAAVIVIVLFAADRHRLVSRLVLVGVALLISVPRSIALNNALNDSHPVAHLFSRSVAIMGVTSLALLVLSGLLVVAEERWGRQWRPRRATVGRRGAAVIAAGALALVVAGAIVAAPHVTHYVRENTRVENSPGSSRLLSLSPEERLDYARVSLDMFVSSPILGSGAGNFGHEYDRLRRFQKHSQYTHDLTLRVLSETGVPGLGLFVVVVLALLLGLGRAIVRPAGLRRGVLVAVLGLTGYFMFHASLDWLDEFPALAAPALALALGAIVADSRRHGARNAPPPTEHGSPRALRWPVAAPVRVLLAVAGTVVATLLLTGPYISTLYAQRALHIYPFHPDAASTALDRAAGWDPLSADPKIDRGLIAEALHEPAAARRAFTDAVQSQRQWYPMFELALLDAQAGRFAAARVELAAAARLDVHDPLLSQARELIDRHRRIDPLRFNQLIDQGPQSSFFATQIIK